MNKEIMRAAGFSKEVNLVENGQCPICSKHVEPLSEFRNMKSQREFHISGMCQKCQDKIFEI